MQQRCSRSPRTAVVVGAGMVGLSVAWFLQERGLEVTVVDRVGVAAGASWGNAGWLSPALAVPLPDPGVLRYGLRSLLDPAAPLHVPLRADLSLGLFLARFARHCTLARWRRGMAAYLAINGLALGAYDRLAEGGVPAPTVEAPILACFERAEQAAELRRELALIREAGQEVRVEEVGGTHLRDGLPLLSGRIEIGLRIDGQRYIDPGRFAGDLAEAVVSRSGRLLTGFGVRALRHGPGGIRVEAWAGEPETADVVVLATGSWLGELARPLGVRLPVRAGRGYSFTVPVERPAPHPIYFPATRVACTPYGGQLRVAGTMELDHPDSPLHPARVDAIVAATRPLLEGADWDGLTDTWVGPRPITPDGLPLIGATRAPGVYVAGGHGMWGITLGPATGQLLAEAVATGSPVPALEAFDPLR